MALTRIFSIAYGYHFAFLAMSLGLLGFGISGTLIALRPGWRAGLSGARLGWIGAAAAVAFAAAYLTANHIPLDPYRVGWDPGQLPLLAAYLVAYALPFLLVGLVQGLPVIAWPERAGRLYAASLIGSGLGGPAALAALNHLSAPATLFAAGGSAALGSVFLSRAGSPAQERRRRAGLQLPAALAVLAALAVVAAVQPGVLQVRMSEFKPLPQLLQFPDSEVAFTASNARSRIDVVDGSSIRSAPGLSLAYEGTLPRQSAAVVDGERVLALTPANDLDAGFLDALPSALTYGLRPGGNVLVLDPGGGLEVASALDGGARSVTALESNPLLAGLLRGRLAGRTGGIYRDPRVELVTTNPRAHLAGGDPRYDVVSLALSENRRSVTAGAFSLSEEFTMTREAFDSYLDRLAPGGLLAVHRWLQLPPAEELRAAALLAESLQESGRDPARHLVAIRSFSTMLLLASNEPFSGSELDRVREFAESRRFDLVHYPGIRAGETNRFNVLRHDRYHEALQGLLADRAAFLEGYEYEVSPPSDGRPFFFHFFKWRQLPTVMAMLGRTWQPFGGSGYLLVVGLLGVTAVLSAAMILLPALVLRRRVRPAPGGAGRAAVYFAGLGLGFLVIEVALVGRLLLVLDHSALAFTVVLFGLLGFSGLGSYLSERIPWKPAIAGLAALAAGYALLLTPVLRLLLTAALPWRVAGAVALLGPLGTLMGVAFPAGIRWLAGTRPDWLPMAWAVNGFTSVIGAVLAALLALSWGHPAVLAAGAGAYLMALAAIWTAGTGPNARPAPAARRSRR